MFPTFYWDAERKILKLVDQRMLPHQIVYRRYRRASQVVSAIANMVVRGAPAIGITGAFGLTAEAFYRSQHSSNLPEFWRYMETAYSKLEASRPTAVNLSWGLRRLWEKADKNASPRENALIWEAEVLRMQKEDVSINHQLGNNGAELFEGKNRLLTHCNAGALATAGWGTALGVIRSAHQQRKVKMVYANETRPYLQGARLTAFELLTDGIPVTLIADSAAGHLILQKQVEAVIVGADRIAANGDTANKIGTCSLAVLAHHAGLPFYIAAPVSTIDISTPKGQSIQIEERNGEEIKAWRNVPVAPREVQAYNPSFDVTPAYLITGIITEKGVIKSPQTPQEFLNKQ